MKQGDTITISGEFEGITNIRSDYVVTAMIYCQNAVTGYKKLLYGSNYNASNAPYNNFVGGTITLTNPNIYSFVIPPSVSSKLQGECQVEVGLTQSGTTAISDNYATFVIQNSVLGQAIS